MIGREEVPAEYLIGQCKVTLEHRGHLSVEVFPSTELLQDLHGEHEDLSEILLLQHTRTSKPSNPKADKGHVEKDKYERTDLKEALAASVKLHAETNVAGLIGAGELTQQSCKDGAGQSLLPGQIHKRTDVNIILH